MTVHLVNPVTKELLCDGSVVSTDKVVDISRTVECKECRARSLGLDLLYYDARAQIVQEEDNKCLTNKLLVTVSVRIVRGLNNLRDVM
jgi:hypothetical protein